MVELPGTVMLKPFRSRVAPTPTAIGPAGRELAAPICRVPPDTVVPPAYVLAPARRSIPGPILVNPPGPATGLLSVKALLTNSMSKDAEHPLAVDTVATCW